MTLKIWVIDHRGVDSTSGNALHIERDRIDKENGDWQQPSGPIIDVWNPRKRGILSERYYADYVGFSGPWLLDVHSDLIGFFGYRKYLWHESWFPLSAAPHCDHAAGWLYTSKPEWDAYRQFFSAWDGASIKQLLTEYDMLQAAPYTYADRNCVDDFVHNCGSARQGQALLEVTQRHGLYDPAWRKNWPNFLMVTRWEVYDQMMRAIHPLMMELDEYHGEDSTSEAYKERPNLYFLERLYPLWLKGAGLNFLELPMLHCRAVGPQAPGW